MSHFEAGNGGNCWSVWIDSIEMTWIVLNWIMKDIGPVSLDINYFSGGHRKNEGKKSGQYFIVSNINILGDVQKFFYKGKNYQVESAHGLQK